jgi:hypothetical protein
MIEYSHVKSEKLISDGCSNNVIMLIHKTGMRILLIFSMLFLANAELNGQSFKNAIEVGVGGGRMIRNYPDFPEINEQALVGSLRYSQKFFGNKPWHKYYNYPVFSLYATGGSMGNNDELGYFAGLMAELSFEKHKPLKKLFWGPRLSLGSAYFTDPYNEQTNNTNVAIGSSFTFLAAAEVMIGYNLNPKTDLIGRISILHASNSHFQLPNVGMNMPVLSGGIRFKLSEQQNNQVDSVSHSLNKKIQFNVRVALGVNEQGSSTAPVNGPKYPIFLTSAFLSKMVSPINKVTLGIEGWYNKGVYDFIVSQEFYESNAAGKSYAVAMVLGHEFIMGHFSIVTNGGIYLYNPFYRDRLERNELTGTKDKLKVWIPARLGFQYYAKDAFLSPKNNWFAGIYIKTNLGQADFLESGIGYQF